MINWDNYANFEEREFACKHTHLCRMRPELLDVLQSMRDEFAKPIFISSGYRHPTHPIEAMKDKPGEHTTGLAVDIIIYTQDCLALLKMALDRGVTRVGLHQKGRASGRFMHLGLADKFMNDYPSSIWTY